MISPSLLIVFLQAAHAAEACVGGPRFSPQRCRAGRASRIAQMFDVPFRTELVYVPSAVERNGEPAGAGNGEAARAAKPLLRLGEFTGLSERGLVG